jgi:hypothetical protein
MRKLLSIFVLLLAISGPHAWAGECASVPDNGRGSQSLELVLAVSVEPAVIEWGGTLQIRLTVTNESDAPVVKGFGSGCIYGFALRDSHGNRVAPPPRICTMNAPTVTCAPGEVVAGEFQWTWDDPNIAPGDYYVEAGFGAMGEGGRVVEVRLR